MSLNFDERTLQTCITTTNFDINFIKYFVKEVQPVTVKRTAISPTSVCRCLRVVTIITALLVISGMTVPSVSERHPVVFRFLCAQILIFDFFLFLLSFFYSVIKDTFVFKDGNTVTKFNFERFCFEMSTSCSYAIYFLSTSYIKLNYLFNHIKETTVQTTTTRPVTTTTPPATTTPPSTTAATTTPGTGKDIFAGSFRAS